MPHTRFHSLKVKIGATIIFIEMLVLTALGVFFTDRFQSQIDHEVEARVMLPGLMINSNELSLNVVENQEALEMLVGQDLVVLVDGLIFGADGAILRSFRSEYLGHSLQDIHANVSNFDMAEPVPTLNKTTVGGITYVTSMTPLDTQAGQPDNLFAYIRVNANQAEQAKSNIARFFTVGIVVSILLTSLASFYFAQRFVLRPLHALLQVIRQVQQGTLTARVDTPIARDEMGAVQVGVNGMIASLEETIDTLIDREARYRTLFTRIPDGLYRSTPDGRLVEGNPALVRILGYDSLEELQGSNLNTRYPDPTKRQDAVRQASEQKETALQLLQKDGSVIWVEDRVNIVYDAAGVPQYYEGILRDITERRMLAQELRESEYRYRAIVEDLTEFVVRGLPDGTRTFVNTSYCEYFGITREEALGTNFYDLIAEQDREVIRQRFASLSPEQPVISGEHQVVLPDGRIGWNAWTDRAIFDEQGTFVAFQSVGRDITAQKQAEIALRESKANLHAVLENIGDTILSIDTAYNLLTLNAAGRATFQSFLGVDPVLGMNVLEQIPEKYARVWKERYDRALTGEQFEVQEVVPFQTYTAYFEVRFNPIRDGASVRGVSVFNREITTRKESEQALAAYAHRIDALHTIDRAILSAESIQAITEEVVKHLYVFIPCYRVSILLLDEEAESFEVVATRAQQENWVKPGLQIQRSDLEAMDVYETLLEGEEVWIRDFLELNTTNPLTDTFISEGIRSGFSVPLITDGTTMGVITIGAQAPNAFSVEHLESAREVAVSLAVALRQAQLVQALQGSNEQLIMISRRLVRLQEEERRRLARELHDEVGGLISSLHLAIKTPTPDATAAMQQRQLVDEVLNAIVEQVRNVSLRLRPHALDELGICAALHWLFSRYQKQTGITVTFEHTLTPDERLDPELETTLYRIVQEALTNVARHAAVMNASVRLDRDDQAIRVEIIDKGHGFVVQDLDTYTDSMGLPGMYERAFLIGGTLTISSAPGAGTTVMAQFQVS